MASSPREGIRQSLLLALVLVSVVLVAATWVDNLSETEPGGFQRGTVAIPTAAATELLQPVATATVTPTAALPPGEQPEATPTRDVSDLG